MTDSQPRPSNPPAPGQKATPAVISLGAGVQSSTMLLMAARGEFGRCPELAIFADTGWEPSAVYSQLDWLIQEAGPAIEVVRVSAGNLRDDLLAFAGGEAKRCASLPLFTAGPIPASCSQCAGVGRLVPLFSELATPEEIDRLPLCERCQGSGVDPELVEEDDGLLRRQCTHEYKIQPAERELRARGFGGRGDSAVRVEQWIGISHDELERIKPSTTPWVDTRWPLVERGMTRADCLRWFHDHYPDRELVKSACVGCPFHSDARWREVRSDPAAWTDVIEVDRRIRSLPKLHSEAFLHRSRRPLDEVDLSTPADDGQLALLDSEGFSAECEGICAT